MVLAPTFVDRDEARAQLDQALLELEEEMVAVRQSIFRDQEKLLLNEFEQEFELYKRNIVEAITLIDGSTDYQQKATAFVSGEQFNRIGNAADQLLHRMAAIKEEGARETTVAMARYSRDTQRLSLGLLLGGLLFGTTVAVWIGRSMKKTTDRLHNAIDNLANGSAADLIPVAGYRNEEWTPERVEPLAEPPIRRASILFVEDNESSQEVTVGLLENAGCTVAIARSGQEALGLLEKSSYDVVLLNMQMMDGINATLEIRKNPAFDTLPVIAMTAGGIHQDSERCLAAGMNGHIAKPIDPDGLFRALMCWVTPDTLRARDNYSR
jgi:CheY-like chemotaxis protein